MRQVDFLVTGATGFTGSAVTDLLVSRGKKVRVLIRDASQSRSYLQRGIEVVVGDLNNEEAMKQAVAGVSTVLHIAALFRQAGLPASEFHRVNVDGTRNLLDRAVEAGVEKVIHCSTVGVMGHIASPPATEQTPFNPGDPYQQSKMEGEKLFLEYVKAGKIRGTVIRPAMIYGPGDTRTLKIFKPIAEGKFFFVGPGEALVHFIDVRDLAESFLLAAERNDVNGEVFIIAGETCLPLNELVSIISQLMGVQEPWLHLPVKPMQALGSICEAFCTPLRINPPIFRRRVDFFTKDRSFDISKAKERLGFKPTRALVQELSEIIDSYVKAGIINLASVRRHSVMLRTMCGKISVWEGDARSLYGWNKDQALGTISHSLLKTEFPMELGAINKTLTETGRWQGFLLHRDHRGQEVKVMSRWKLLSLPSNADPLILETNTLVVDSTNGGKLMAPASSVMMPSLAGSLFALTTMPTFQL